MRGTPYIRLPLLGTVVLALSLAACTPHARRVPEARPDATGVAEEAGESAEPGGTGAASAAPIDGDVLTAEAALPFDEGTDPDALSDPPDEEVSPSPLDELADVTPEIDPPALEEERAIVEAVEPEFDIPMVTNDKVLFWIDYYTDRHRSSFLKGLERSGRYVPMFREIFRQEGLPQDLVYMAHVESAYKTNAYSRARAMGVWQFIASTGRRYDLHIDYWVDERKDPEKAARSAARYLKKLYGDFGDWYLAMAAYNGGEGRIGRALARSGKDDFWGIAETRHIRRETKNYVPAILAAIQISKNPERFGMEFEPDPEIHYDKVEVEGAVDLQVLADCAGADFETMRLLNPALRRQQTPPHARTEVRVPVGSAERTLIALAKIPEEERVLYVRHRIRSGDTLSELARAYGVSVYAIQQANGMGRRTMINVGKELVIPTVAAGRFSGSRTTSASRTPTATHSTGETVHYRVRRGDTLSGIARRYGTTAQAIAAASGISVHKTLQIGERLTVVSGARTPAQAAAALSDAVADAGGSRTYTVRRGDTLWRIASMFSTSVDRLCALNGLSRTSTLYPGTRLNVGP